VKPPVKVLGISASPVAGGNVEKVLERALASQQDQPGVNCEMIPLRDLEIADCRQCNWCLKKQRNQMRCSVEDDMKTIYPLVEEADALILATPVYFGRLSGHLACFLDRMRVYVHGNVTMGAMRNKVGGSIAVAWFRFAGLEMALLSMNQFFYAVNMIIAAPDIGLQGGAVLSSLGGTGSRDGEDRLLALRDEMGMASALSTVERAVELARIMKAGASSLNLEGP
jgi:multimeric flavodoxin WrbA